MFNCAECQTQECQVRGKDSLNPSCPMQNKDFFTEIRDTYHQQENQSIYDASIKSMCGSFAHWTRMQEIIKFCNFNGYKRLGLAYCSGMLKEGRIANEILKENGFTVIAVGCKVGGFSPDELCHDFKPTPANMIQTKKQSTLDSMPLLPNSSNLPIQRAICDPIGQAELLNTEKTDFNILLGLCVGHDSFFLKYSKALCTVLVVKDRMLNNNPVAALYCHEAEKHFT